MLYHLFAWLAKEGFRFPGIGLFQFITFRVLLAMILSLVITTVYGKKLIKYLQKKQLGESVRDLGLAGTREKRNTNDGWYHYHSCDIDTNPFIGQPGQSIYTPHVIVYGLAGCHWVY